jgi:prephenate dehydrogenase
MGTPPPAFQLDEPNVAIVGVGLIGGSIAAALKARGFPGNVVGVGRNPARLQGARDAGLIDEIATTTPAESRFVVYCTPVDRIAAQVVGDAARSGPGTLMTDAGSVKGRIQNAVAEQLPAGVTFVGSHPLAGSEKAGWEHADANLYEGRMCILTPDETTPALELDRARRFWEFLGMRVVELSAEDHDRILAMTSHVPHAVAAALAGALAASESPFAATGFRDTTRIASGEPEIWVPILLANRDAVLRGLDRVRRRLERIHRAVEVDDAIELERLLAQGKLVREGLDG